LNDWRSRNGGVMRAIGSWVVRGPRARTTEEKRPCLNHWAFSNGSRLPEVPVLEPLEEEPPLEPLDEVPVLEPLESEFPVRAA
jgi:hypothetical protein